MNKKEMIWWYFYDWRFLSIKNLKFKASSWIKITQPSVQTKKKKMTVDNRILASAIFLNAKVVGQERKWVDLTDND